MRLPAPSWVPEWAANATNTAIVAAIAIAIALALHFILFAILARITHLSPMTSDGLVVERVRHPLRWSLVAVALSLAGEADPALAHLWSSVARFVVPALLGWVAFGLVRAFGSPCTAGRSFRPTTRQCAAAVPGSRSCRAPPAL